MLGAGRMGRQVMRDMAGRQDCVLAGVWVRPGNRLLGADLTSVAAAAAADAVVSSDLAAVLGNADVAIDFSLPSATATVIDGAVAACVPLVIGVSGIAQAELAALERASRSIPVFYERNMSVGVAVLRRLVQLAGAVLGDEFAAEIRDLHHAQKRDAPSGTALMLGETLAASRGHDPAAVLQYGPAAARHAPANEAVRFHVTREGDHPGRHEVVFTRPGERLELCHEVSDRAVFAHGALRAAHWLAGREPGRYGMQQLLGEHAA